MLDGFDYKEPACSLCGGKEFYSPDKDAPSGRIPVMRIIEKLDGFLNRNDTESARAHLVYWKKEAEALRDRQGELAVTDELIGFYRKAGEKDAALAACARADELIAELGLNDTVSAATITLNIATAYKAFGMSEKAVPLYEKTESVYKKHLPPEDPLFAGLYNNEALALADLKRYEEAEALYKKAISLTEKAENGAPDRAISYINLAQVYEAQQKPKTLITDCMYKAYELLSDESVLQNGYLAFVLSKCYPAFARYGYDVIAKELKEKSEKLYERS